MLYDRFITISVGGSRTSKNWRSQTMSLSELYERLRTPLRSTETMAAFMAMQKRDQDNLKDIGGFVAGSLSGPRRKAGAVTGRDVLTLDLDNIPPNATANIIATLESLGCGYCVYSTRKHRPDAPRLRILFPLDRTCTADEYGACGRRTATYVDPDLTMIDPTTFEAHRLMYWPSCCADSEYVYYFADKPMLSVDGLLATYADWRDTASWPAVPGAVNPTRLAARQGDPTAKTGVVGAFCRVYDVPAAMDAFLPGVYEETTTPGRYTFTGGSTTGGAIVYDEGKFLYSHHATDPCSNRLVNAFDLVRLHKFGHLDDEDSVPEGARGNRLPSFTAMTAFAREDHQVAGLLIDERWQQAQAAFGPVTEDGEDDGSWRRLMDLDGQGKPLKSLKNLQITLEHDPKLKGKMRLDLFSDRINITAEMPWTRPGISQAINDTDAAQLRLYLEPFLGKVGKDDLTEAIRTCASNQAYHSVRDYLNSLRWDGTPRLDTLFIDYLGAENTEYIRAVTRKSFTGAVARVMRPGCKYDTMPILVGAQGRFKSTILAKMGGIWFSDSLRTFGDKDAMETIQGTWINEIAEMQAMAKADVNAVKMFLTKTKDYYRASYGKFASEHYRQCVFFGTTNSKECLNDPTGGRRWWPVDIDIIERKKNVFQDLDEERDQLWAEAVMRWKLGEPLILPPHLELIAAQMQEAHRARHPWEGMIVEYLKKKVPENWNMMTTKDRMAWHGGGLRCEGELVLRDRICAAEIWCEMLQKPRGDLKQRDSKAINEILGRVPGWVEIGVRQAGRPYGKQRCFRRTGAADDPDNGNR